MTLVSEVVSGIQKGTTYFFRLIATDSNDVTTTGLTETFKGGKPMVKITSVTPSGCAGTWSANDPFRGHVSISVTGDEGKFSVGAKLVSDGTWEGTFPATLATGTYAVNARLWELVAAASDKSSLTVP